MIRGPYKQDEGVVQDEDLLAPETEKLHWYCGGIQISKRRRPRETSGEV